MRCAESARARSPTWTVRAGRIDGLPPWLGALSWCLVQSRQRRVAMKYLSRVCLAVAFVALAVPASARTSLTPGQSAKVYRIVIPQGRGRAPIVRERFVIKLVVPMPVARKRIEDAPGAANSTLVNDELAVPDAPVNTDKVSVVNDALAVSNASANTDKAPMVNGALAVPGAPANTDTVPANFSPHN